MSDQMSQASGKQRRTSMDYHEVARNTTLPANDNGSANSGNIKRLAFVLIPLIGFLTLLAWF